MLLIDGTFYHLWYFPACITGLLLVWLLRRFLPLLRWRGGGDSVPHRVAGGIAITA